MNQIVRPFMARWHKLSLGGAFNDASQRAQFHRELDDLRGNMRHYAGMLADIAQVEDITDIEDV